MSALFSPCRTWRYSLTRDVAPLTGEGTCAFIGLNPSTADETQDDPTIRRCMRFAREWGFEQLAMLNAYAYRSTDPNGLWPRAARGVDIIGPENDEWIARVCDAAELIVCAWGVHARADRVARVLELVTDPHCLGFTKDGAPRHPLYIKADTKPIRYAA